MQFCLGFIKAVQRNGTVSGFYGKKKQVEIRQQNLTITTSQAYT